ncbi:MAG: hypothetical protein NTW86_23265, partial [Candidatus Sumerlaeota bacterium]|nr:hypothetical protein [Candidatus Sumerlaeota bacterium]
WLNSNAGTDADDDLDPQAVSIGPGRFAAVWWSVAALTDVYSTWLGIPQAVLLSHSYDGGASWGAPRIVKSGPGVDAMGDFAPAAAASRSNRMMAVWHSEDSLGGTIGTDADILAWIKSGWSSAAHWRLYDAEP